MDDLDRAKEREMADRERALQAQLAKGLETETPLYIEGVRCCLDCYDPIPEKRIEARPESVRCLSCKELLELRARQYR
jgi:DnaK suppressor protein